MTCQKLAPRKALLLTGTKRTRATPLAVGLNTASQAEQQAVMNDLAARLAPFKRPDWRLRVPFTSYLARGYK